MDTTPSTPVSFRDASSPDQSSSPSAWSTPGTSYVPSPSRRKSSINLAVTSTGSPYVSDSLPAVPQGSEWDYEEASLRWKSKRFTDRVATTASSLLRDNEEQPVDGVAMSKFNELKLGKEIGQGQWSCVYAATVDHIEESIARHASIFQTTLSSQRSMDQMNSSLLVAPPPTVASSLVAVKVGRSKSSVRVLHSEARFLQLLMARPFSTRFVVRFHGYDMDRNMLIMENISQTLEAYIAAMEIAQALERSYRVITEVLPISQHLVDGLSFLHREKIIHGDIKPTNILIRQTRRSGAGQAFDQALDLHSVPSRPKGNKVRLPNVSDRHDFTLDRGELEAVYCDFSASRFDKLDSIPTQSAGTYDYMAPELFVRTIPDNYPTTCSDVYALGVTLLYAVTGHSPYAHATNVFMRRAMAIQGKPLDFARTDDTSLLRLEEAQFEPIVRHAVQARAHDRWTAKEWKNWFQGAGNGDD